MKKLLLTLKEIGQFIVLTIIIAIIISVMALALLAPAYMADVTDNNLWFALYPVLVGVIVAIHIRNDLRK